MAKLSEWEEPILSQLSDAEEDGYDSTLFRVCYATLKSSLKRSRRKGKRVRFMHPKW